MNLLSRVPAKHLAPRGHAILLPHWLTRLGGPGLFFVAVIDSSIVPIPLPGSTDLLLLWLVAHNGNPYLLTSMAISGSIVGGFTTWDAGRRGGEAALNKHVPKRILKRVVAWVKNHPMLSLFVPAILPPPVPLLPFALASGALGVTRSRFLIVYGLARTLRYSLIAWLAAVYGRRVIRIWSGTMAKWSAPLLWVFGGLMVAGVCFGVWKIRSLRKSAAPVKPTLRANSAAID